MVRVAQLCECTQCHWTVRLNMVKIVCFILCDFYHNKKTLKSKDPDGLLVYSLLPFFIGEWLWTMLVVVQSLSHVQFFGTPWSVACQLLCPPLSLGVCSDSCPLNQWYYLSISSSAAPFSHYQSFLAPGSFPMSCLFASSGQSIGASASSSVLPINIQDCFPLFIYFFPISFISWMLITLQYCSGFCQTLTWINHRFTCVPHPEPLSHLPPHPIPLGHPMHQPRALVSCIQPGLAIFFTLDNIHVSMLFSWNISPSPSPIESKSLFYTSVSLFLSCI